MTQFNQNSNIIFNRVFGGDPNFMTPRILDRQMTGGHHYEVSVGSGIGGEVIYGFTVLTSTGGRCPDLSGCYHSMIEIDQCIRNLSNEGVSNG